MKAALRRTKLRDADAMSSTKNWGTIVSNWAYLCHWGRQSITWRSSTLSQISPLLKSTTTPLTNSFRLSTTFLSVPMHASTDSQPSSGRPGLRESLGRRKKLRRSTGEPWRRAGGPPLGRIASRARASSPLGSATFPLERRWSSNSSISRNSPSLATLFTS